MTAVHDRVARISRWLAWAGGAMILAAAAVICVEVVLRVAFAKSFAGVDEVAGYALAISTTWACGYALLHKAHVRIDTVYFLLPRGVRPYLDLGALIALFGFVALLTCHAAELAALSAKFGSRSMTPLATPLWLPQGLWVLGLIAFLLAILVLLRGAVGALMAGKAGTVSQLAGPISIDEELHEELGDIVRRGSTTGESS